jgi:CHAD domain-containing protein
MQEVDGRRVWRRAKKLPRKLFLSLGALRDLHVLETWVRQLASADDPVRAKLLEVLEDREAVHSKKVRRAARKFDDKAWKQLTGAVRKRARLIPPDSPAAQSLVLERYEDFHRLHARAVRTDRPPAWHALRVALKRFRYAIEILLPGRSAVCEEGLGEMQAKLGEVHDLDVLRSRIAAESDGIDGSAAGSIRHAIAAKRHACIEQYRERMTGDAGLLRVWRAGLPHGEAVAAATTERLRTTSRAMDPHPRRTAAVARLALAMYDGLASSAEHRGFREKRLRTVLWTAAQLHAIRVSRGQIARHKAARAFLRSVRAPLGWSAADWEVVAEVVRYRRGAEPAATHKGFARLSADRQHVVRGLAGILRLARGLRRCGVSPRGGVRINETSAYVRLCVPGLRDTEESAARLAAAKHLLEKYLHRPMLIEAVHAPVPMRAPRLVYNSPLLSAPPAFDRRRRA